MKRLLLILAENFAEAREDGKFMPSELLESSVSDLDYSSHTLAKLMRELKDNGIEELTEHDFILFLEQLGARKA